MMLGRLPRDEFVCFIRSPVESLISLIDGVRTSWSCPSIFCEQVNVAMRTMLKASGKRTRSGLSVKNRNHDRWGDTSSKLMVCRVVRHDSANLVLSTLYEASSYEETENRWEVYSPKLMGCKTVRHFFDCLIICKSLTPCLGNRNINSFQS